MAPYAVQSMARGVELSPRLRADTSNIDRPQHFRGQFSVGVGKFLPRAGGALWRGVRQKSKTPGRPGVLELLARLLVKERAQVLASCRVAQLA